MPVAPALVAALVVMLLGAGLPAPAWAAGDDSFGLDERLQGLGFDDAYTLPEPLRSGDEEAVGMGVWYTSDAADEGAVLDEMDQIARTVWEHAGYRIARVVVQATEAPEWSERGVPPGLLLDRPELAQRYGDRDRALDAEGLGDAEFWGVAGDDEVLPFLVVGGIVALLALVIPFVVGGAVGGAVGYALGRRAADPWRARRDPSPPAGPTPWTSPPPPPGRPAYQDQPPYGERPPYGEQRPYGSQPPAG